MNFLRNLIQGSQSANKADPGKKKGPGASVGLGGPPGEENPEQEGEGTREPEVITQQHHPLTTTTTSPPSPPPPPPPSDSPSHSVRRECDTSSVSEDTTTYVSCLTQEAVTPSQEQRNHLLAQNTQHSNESTLNSDSEYESAEEINLPTDPPPGLVLDVTPDSIFGDETLSPAYQDTICLAGTEEVKETALPVDQIELSETPACETQTPAIENSICLTGTREEVNNTAPSVTAAQHEAVPPATEDSVNAPESAVTCSVICDVDGQQPSIAADKKTEPVPQEQPEYLPSIISEALVTVTKSEIIKNTICEKEVLIDETVTVSPCDIQLEEKIDEILPLESQGLDINNPCESKEESGNAPTSLCDVQLHNEIQVGEANVVIPDNSENTVAKANLDQHHDHNNKVEISESPSELKLNLQPEKKTEESDHHIVSNSNATPVFSKEHEVPVLRETEVQEKLVASEIHKLKEADVQDLPLPAKKYKELKEADVQDSPVPSENPEKIELAEVQESHPVQPINLDEANQSLSSPPDVAAKEEPLSQPVIDPDDIPIVPKKGYNLDFLESLDDPNFNPFATKTAVRTTPPPSPDPTQKLPPLKPAIKKKKTTQVDSDTKPQTFNNSTEEKSKESNIVSEQSVLSDKNKITNNNNENLENSEIQDQSFNLTFDDPVKPPPRKLGSKPDLKSKKNPAPKVTRTPKVVETNNNTVEGENVINPGLKPDTEDLPIPPSKGYNLDFLDQLDDPNFDPFSTNAAVRNSPPKDGFTISTDRDEEKPIAKVVPANKAPPRKGYSAIKNKSKATVPDSESTTSSENLKDTKVSETNSSPAVDNSDTKFSEDGEEDALIPPSKGYNLDFLDDPNFDPFKIKPAFNNQGFDTPKVPVPVGIQEVPKANAAEEAACAKDIKSDSDGSKCQDTDKDSGIYQDLPTQTSTTESRLSEIDIAATDLNITGSITNEPLHDVNDNSNLEVDTSSVTESSLKTDIEVSEVEVEGVSNNNLSTVQAAQSEVFETKHSPNVVNGESTTVKSLVEHPETHINVHKVPSIGTIGQLDSLEFDKLLGHEASRLAEEFMNCSTDSGLPDSQLSTPVKSVQETMGDTSCANNNLDENVNPFIKSSRMSRSPPLGKRGAVCGAESSEAAAMAQPFLTRRSLKRENVLGEERMDLTSMDDDSGIVVGDRSDLETDANHSEAGPEIATGLTSSDLLCASQFFKDATDLENQLRKTLISPLRGSHSKLSSSEEGTPTKERKDPPPSITPESPQNKPVPSTSSPARPVSSPAPPREERSAPEGTSSPTPRPSDTSERKLASTRPTSAPPEGYMTATEVQKLLKQQELKFEEKLLQVELAAGEKEKKLHQTMKDEQKELSSLGSSVSELTQSRDALLNMVGQYKGMLASLVSEKEKDKQAADEKLKAMEVERNQALDDLANVEVAFSDVHRKYERTKQVVDTLRRNEDTLRGAVADYETKLQKQEHKFVEFQKHAEEKIQLANEEFENMRKANEQEMTKMAALLKKAEMKIMSLQDSFDRKTRENQELTQLCDDLISKVGK